MSSRHKHILAAALTLLILPTIETNAQEKRSLEAEEYGRWESPGQGRLSPDGRWLVHDIRRSDGNNELRIHEIASGKVTVAAFGEAPAFSDDSLYLAYRTNRHEDERARMGDEGTPVRNGLGLFDTETGTTETIDGVASFAFSESGKYLAIHRYPPERSRRNEDREDDDGPRGADLIIRDLVRGADLHFGNVSEFAWQDEGSLLAIITSAEGRVGNGVRLLDPASGRLRTLDSADAVYSGLAWREDADDLAAFRSFENEDYEGDSHSLLAWRNLGSLDRQDDGLSQFDPNQSAGFPAEMRIVSFRRPEWTEDGRAVLFGIQPWDRKPEPPESDTDDENEEDATSVDKPSNVEVWHSRDPQIIPQQKLTANRDREKNDLSIWHLESDTFVRLGDETTETVVALDGGRSAIALDLRRAEFDAMFGRGRRDVYLVDLEDGARRMILEQIPGGSRFPDRTLTPSPDGRHIAYLKDDDYWIYDVRNDTHTNVTDGIPTSFVDVDDDHPSPVVPPYGIAGWLEGRDTLLVYDKWDVWSIPVNGSDPTRLTRGAEQERRHRYVRLDPEEDWIDPDQAMYLSTYGEWTKEFGFARIPPGQNAEQLVRMDKDLTRLSKAEHADVFAFMSQDFDDSPDYFVGGPDLNVLEQVTRTNPFFEEYHWGRSELIEYENSQGDRLQGALYYPADYEPGRQYPMVVYIYEKLSQSVHRFATPSERSTYNTSVFTTQGYFVLQPDIVFRAREPGASALDCITSGVEKVLETGMIDRDRIGLIGHSWGGYETAFLVTQTDMFAAAVAGAALTNFFSMYGSVFWNSGVPETGHFEVGQERMEVPFWEDIDAYIRNSPIYSIENMNTPLLMEFGDRDGSVDWQQGIEMYNAARRLGKEMVLLVYPGENHSVRRKENQIDYHHRILDWFGHKLQGQEPAKWIIEGMPHLEREKEIKRITDQQQ